MLKLIFCYKERDSVEKLSETYTKRTFDYEEDAIKEISKLIEKDFKKMKYHTISIEVLAAEKRKRGGQSKYFSRL